MLISQNVWGAHVANASGNVLGSCLGALFGRRHVSVQNEQSLAWSIGHYLFLLLLFCGVGDDYVAVLGGKDNRTRQKPAGVAGSHGVFSLCQCMDIQQCGSIDRYLDRLDCAWTLLRPSCCLGRNDVW